MPAKLPGAFPGGWQRTNKLQKKWPFALTQKFSTGMGGDVGSSAANGVATVTAAVVRDRALTASATGTATVGETVVRIRTLTASSIGSATVTAAVVRLKARTAAANGSSAASATIVRNRAFTASATGSSTVSAGISGAVRLLTASSQGVATVSATFQQPEPFVPGGFYTVSRPDRVINTQPFERDVAVTATSTGRASIRCRFTIEPTRRLTATTTGHSSIQASVTLDPYRGLSGRSEGLAGVRCELTKTDLLDRELEQLLALELIPA